MPYQLPASAYSAVRAAIDIELDDVMLPDAILSLDIYAGEAGRFIDRQMTAAQIAANPKSAETAAAFYCAAKIVPSYKQVVRDRRSDDEQQYAALDLKSKAEELLNNALRVVQEVQAASEPDAPGTVIEMPIFFGASRREFR